MMQTSMASQAQQAGMVVVVGQQFCAPYPVDLTIAKKAISLSHGDFLVTDINGNVVFNVRGKVLSIRNRRVLVDAAGKPLVTMRHKIISAHDRWEVFRGDSTDHKDLLFSCKKSSILQLRTQLDVFLAANTSEHVCDFKVRGSYFDRSCTIYRGDTNAIVAQMSRRFTVKNVLLGKDTFGVTVYPNVDYAFITALIVILDEIHRDKKED